MQPKPSAIDALLCDIEDALYSDGYDYLSVCTRNHVYRIAIYIQTRQAQEIQAMLDNAGWPCCVVRINDEVSSIKPVF
jgi:hypothetical protein